MHRGSLKGYSKVYRTAIAQAGGIAPLVKLVAQLGGNATLAKARQEAAVALANLARTHGANQSAIAAAGAVLGAVPALVRLLRSTEELDQLAQLFGYVRAGCAECRQRAPRGAREGRRASRAFCLAIRLRRRAAHRERMARRWRIRAEALHKLLSLVMTLVIELLRLVMTLVIELLSLDDLGAV
jgi:hypothetical protein